MTAKSIDDATLKVLGTIADAILDKKGEDIVIYDVREISSLTQYFVLCNGTNVRQNATIADEITGRLKPLDTRPLHEEEGANSGWTLLDFGFVIIHVFLPKTRELYNLEGLWGDARQLNPEELAAHAV